MSVPTVCASDCGTGQPGQYMVANTFLSLSYNMGHRDSNRNVRPLLAAPFVSRGMTMMQGGSGDMQVELMFASAAFQESSFGAEPELKPVSRHGSAIKHSFSFACKQQLKVGVWLWW